LPPLISALPPPRWSIPSCAVPRPITPRLREAAGKPATGAIASIHEQTRVKEPGLERFLRYDRWPRHAFRVMIFDPARTHADYEALELREDVGFAGGPSP